MSNLRKIEKLHGSDWVICAMKDLVEGDIFKVYESIDNEYIGEWLAISKPTLQENNIWSITVEPSTNDKGLKNG
jgi:hypothetical protein